MENNSDQMIRENKTISIVTKKAQNYLRIKPRKAFHDIDGTKSHRSQREKM